MEDPTPLIILAATVSVACGVAGGWDLRAGSNCWAIFWVALSVANMLGALSLVGVAT